MKSVMLQREEISRKVILPLFGSHIQVKETDTDLVVSGIQWHGEPSAMRLPAYDDLADPECRTVDLLSGYDEDRRLSQTERSKAPHFLFANADTLAKQKEFVRTFGPVQASEIDRTTSRPGLPTITVHQNIEALRFEQQLYSLIFDLTKHVNDLIPFSRKAFKEVKPEMRVILLEHPDRYSNVQKMVDTLAREAGEKVSKVDSCLTRSNILTRDVKDKLDKLRELLSGINAFLDPSPEDNLQDLIENPTSLRHLHSWQNTRSELLKASSLDVIDRANELLCELFNRFPLILCYADGMAQEMPDTNASGILPALYYMLRLEYLYEREIRRCADPKCGGYFVPGRKNRVHCSDLCTGRAMQQRHRKRKELLLGGSTARKQTAKSRIQRAQQDRFELRKNDKSKSNL